MFKCYIVGFKSYSIIVSRMIVPTNLLLILQVLTMLLQSSGSKKVIVGKDFISMRSSAVVEVIVGIVEVKWVGVGGQRAV